MHTIKVPEYMIGEMSWFLNKHNVEHSIEDFDDFEIGIPFEAGDGYTFDGPKRVFYIIITDEKEFWRAGAMYQQLIDMEHAIERAHEICMTNIEEMYKNI